MSMRFTSVQLVSNEYSGSKAVQSVLIACECDTTADLPNQLYTDTADAQVVLVMGSTAHIIEGNLIYEMKSTGVWEIQDEASRMNVYTKPEVDQLLQDRADIQANIDSAQDDIIDRNQDLLAEIIDSGAKNKLEMTQSQTTITRTSGNSSMTAVYDKDAGTVTLSGTHYSADSAFAFEFYTGAAVDTKPIPAGTYRMTGCYPGGSTSTWRAVLTGISGAVDTGSGATFTLEASQYCAWRILVSGNCTLDNAVFYPMVTPQDAYDISEAFVPYCPTLQELYQLVKSYHS